jgi:hypothetical protein
VTRRLAASLLALLSMVGGLLAPAASRSESGGPALSDARVRQLALSYIDRSENMLGRVLVRPRILGVERRHGGGDAYRWLIRFDGAAVLGCGGRTCTFVDHGTLLVAQRRVDGRIAFLGPHLLHRQGDPYLTVPGSQIRVGTPKRPAPRTAAEATDVALTHLTDAARALAISTTRTRVVSLTRLEPGAVLVVDRRRGAGLKAVTGTWVARVEGVLPSCVNDYGRIACEVARAGYLAIPDDRASPVALVLQGPRTKLRPTAIGQRGCSIDLGGRITCP